MDNYILSVLNRSIKEKVIVSVYSNRYQPEMSSVGSITLLSAEQFVMKHVTPEGLNDGYIVRRVEDVFRVDVNGEYEQRLELLYTLQNQQHEDFIQKSVTQESNLFRESLLTAQKKNFAVTVCIDETEKQNDIVGFVKNVHPEAITISRISFVGLDDGESTICIRDVIKINCNTTDENSLKLLYHHKNGNV